MRVGITHPEWICPLDNGKISYGYHQEWYDEPWQRLAGCGPTTAAQLVAYVSARDARMAMGRTIDEAVVMMNRLWKYVTPRHGGGLYKTSWFKQGLENYINDYRLQYKVELIRIAPFFWGRPTYQEVSNFIISGLLEDCPVAFLNRHRGGESGLETWHWVPLVSLEKREDDCVGIVFDEEVEKKFSLKNWLQKSTLGGGFLYIKK